MNTQTYTIQRSAIAPYFASNLAKADLCRKAISHLRAHQRLAGREVAA